MEKRDAGHETARPNGVVVVSGAPFLAPRWWDSPWLHLPWSYASWLSVICAAYGWKAPRRAFERWLTGGRAPAP